MQLLMRALTIFLLYGSGLAYASEKPELSVILALTGAITGAYFETLIRNEEKDKK